MPDNPNIEKIPDIIEQVPSQEQTSDAGRQIETAPETSAVIEREDTQAAVTLPDDTSQVKSQVSNTQIILQEVENILSHDMDKTFLNMDVATQHQFKIKGEQTSRQIILLLQKGKIGIKKITALILEWLRIIPQVNKHYIEQTAKIKAENIISMYKNK